jgi:hypothetical protein
MTVFFRVSALCGDKSSDVSEEHTAMIGLNAGVIEESVSRLCTINGHSLVNHRHRGQEKECPEPVGAKISKTVLFLCFGHVENMWTLTAVQSLSVTTLRWLCLALELVNIFIFPLSGWCNYYIVGKHLLTFFKVLVWGSHRLLSKNLYSWFKLLWWSLISTGPLTSQSIHQLFLARILVSVFNG